MQPSASSSHVALAPVAVAWEECTCPLCDDFRYTPVMEARDPTSGLTFLIVKCPRCGLAFTNPRPDRVSIEQFYPATYRGHQGTTTSKDADPLTRLLPMRGQARLLDFGCGAGDFLAQMHSIGWQVVGLDTSEAAIAHVRDTLRLPAYVGTLPFAEWIDARFEAITMRQSLEHVHQPLAALRAAYRLLTNGGRLIITAPNFDGLGSRWFGPWWYGLDVPRHLTHFTEDTLQLMLRHAGFARVEMRQERHNSWIRHSAEVCEGKLAQRLRTRLGSSIAGWWGLLCGRAEGIVAIAVK
jgi:SAM-dependent methyltransferase